MSCLGLCEFKMSHHVTRLSTEPGGLPLPSVDGLTMLVPLITPLIIFIIILIVAQLNTPHQVDTFFYPPRLFIF